jgi:hypothetical protein
MSRVTVGGALAHVAERLRRNDLYVVVVANLLLLASLVLVELGYATLPARAPGGVGLVVGAWWWYRAVAGDLMRSDRDEIFRRVVEDD